MLEMMSNAPTKAEKHSQQYTRFILLIGPNDIDIMLMSTLLLVVGPNVILRPKNNNLVFRAMVLKTLGRVGSVFFFKNWNLNYKDPNEKKMYFCKKKSRVGRFT